MLSDRIQKTGRGFSVIKESNTDEGRELFYGTYTLKESPDYIPELKEAEYWQPMKDCEIKIAGPGCFVYVVEKQFDETVEDTRFYWNASLEKPILSIKTVPADRKYGDKAFKIVISWNNSDGEPINNEYIFLKSVSGEKFHFLRKLIGGIGKKEDVYIYVVPEGDDPELYSVSVLPQIKQKYTITME